jgi:hypothetical protein
MLARAVVITLATLEAAVVDSAAQAAVIGGVFLLANTGLTLYVTRRRRPDERGDEAPSAPGKRARARRVRDRRGRGR